MISWQKSPVVSLYTVIAFKQKLFLSSSLLYANFYMTHDFSEEPIGPPAVTSRYTGLHAVFSIDRSTMFVHVYHLITQINHSVNSKYWSRIIKPPSVIPHEHAYGAPISSFTKMKLGSQDEHDDTADGKYFLVWQKHVGQDSGVYYLLMRLVRHCWLGHPEL